jgi:abortive infection bacteriophage resistance protein
MRYLKPAITISDQVARLKARSLMFDNESEAELYLSNISYYRLRAYTYSFQNNTDPGHPFIFPVTFEQIIGLYLFDRQLSPAKFAKQINSLQTEIDRSHETFIEHYYTTYSEPSEPPSWMSLEVSSFGLLSQIFNASRNTSLRALPLFFRTANTDTALGYQPTNGSRTGFRRVDASRPPRIARSCRQNQT